MLSFLGVLNCFNHSKLVISSSQITRTKSIKTGSFGCKFLYLTLNKNSSSWLKIHYFHDFKCEETVRRIRIFVPLINGFSDRIEIKLLSIIAEQCHSYVHNYEAYRVVKTIMKRLLYFVFETFDKILVRRKGI